MLETEKGLPLLIAQLLTTARPGWVHTTRAGSGFFLKPHREADPRASEGAEDIFRDELEDGRQRLPGNRGPGWCLRVSWKENCIKTH